MLTFVYNTDDALRLVNECQASMQGKGLLAVTAHIMEVITKAKDAAFAKQSNPRTGDKWAALSPRTRRKFPGANILTQTGEMNRLIQTGYEMSNPGARIVESINDSGDVYRRAMVHLYGIRPRMKRSGGKKRVNPMLSMPARRWAGISQAEVRDCMQFAKNNLFGFAMYRP